MKPLLSATLNDLKTLDGRFPLAVSPKLDGIRALKYKGKLVSRNLKPIPNEYTQYIFKAVPDGFDGELVVGNPASPDCFRKTSSGVMSVNGEPHVSFHLFDNFLDPDMEFKVRYELVREYSKVLTHVKAVPHKKIKDAFGVHTYEQLMISRGYEGIMLRSLNGKYKHGRSTLKEGYLMKLKRFEDSEAKIYDMEEKMHNKNTLEVDNLGHAKRSSKKSGLVPAGVMGALKVQDIHTGVMFDIGAGFTDKDREWFWHRRKTPAMKNGATIVKYKYFPTGSKEKPRFPVFLGFRDEIDI